MLMISYKAPDLSQHPPRSPRVRLGGFVHLPRFLDKARAAAAGTLGEYIFPCPMDKRMLAFLGLEADAFLDQVKAGRSDTEILAWVLAQAKPTRAAWEIEAWSRWMEESGPGDAGRHEGMAKTIRELAADRDDIRTNFDRLDLDDYVSFGGRG